jgi:transcriptional regulator with XRE-family HTH domain
MKHPIEQWRAEKGLSQRDLAKELGASAISVSRWERGERKIDARWLADLYRVTGIEPAVLRPDLARVLG